MTTNTISTISKQNVIKLERIQNRALKYAFNERYPYTKNTETLHQEANLQPINYNLYTRTERLFSALREIQTNQYIYVNKT